MRTCRGVKRSAPLSRPTRGRPAASRPAPTDPLGVPGAPRGSALLALDGLPGRLWPDTGAGAEPDGPAGVDRADGSGEERGLGLADGGSDREGGLGAGSAGCGTGDPSGPGDGSGTVGGLGTGGGLGTEGGLGTVGGLGTGGGLGAGRGGAGTEGTGTVGTEGTGTVGTGTCAWAEVTRPVVSTVTAASFPLSPIWMRVTYTSGSETRTAMRLSRAGRAPRMPLRWPRPGRACRRRQSRDPVSTSAMEAHPDPAGPSS